MTWSQNETTLGQNAVLGWAAASANALGLTTVVQSGLLLMFQQRYNAAIPLYQSLQFPVSRIAEDGAWGGQSALALIVAIAAGRSGNESAQFLRDTGIYSAFDFDHNGAALNTKAKLTARYAQLRDAVSAFANRTQGVLRAFDGQASALVDTVRNAPTTADVGARARTLLGTMFQDGGAPSATTAQVVSTRTVPSDLKSSIDQATQTPSSKPQILPPSADDIAAGRAQADITLNEPMQIQPDTFGRRLNLKVIVPVAVVGTLLLVFAMKQRGRRA